MTQPDAPASPATPPAHRYTPQLAQEIEGRWQELWERARAFRVPNPGEPGFDASRPRYYCLDMFPYPSGAGLHVGHPEGYTATDIVSRFKRMKGYNVLHPMGWDAFGLPAEQYAIQTGVHPAKTTRSAIDNFRRQLKRFGFCYDWSRELGTIDEEYYRWTQWIFLQLYNAWFNPLTNKGEPIATLVRAAERRAIPTPKPWDDMRPHERDEFLDSHRLAYLSEAVVNWCPKLGTVLANDEVIDGRSERGGHPVFRKPLKQWVFRITAYAQRLLDQLEGLDWPEKTKAMQGEWIGRSEGAEIDFALEHAGGAPGVPRGGSLRVFTTRPDTIFGATYMVVAPEHELCERVLDGGLPVAESVRAALRSYVDASRRRSDVDRQASREKSGVFTGVRAINPATGKPIEVWAADYVLMGYGTGAIMAVPSGDERDMEFARAFSLPIVRVVQAPGRTLRDDECYSGEGVNVNSSNAEINLDGSPTPHAKRAIVAWLERRGLGRARTNFRLRDWTFSRQRYWGEPFPIVYADGKPYPVGEHALPVRLPELADYAPVESDEPQPLLAKATAWVRTTAGQAGVDPSLLAPDTPVTRECNTMPGSAGSSWYAIRYCDPRNASRLVGSEAEKYWMGPGNAGAGVDLYLGGSEHAVGHLLYARFWQNVLFDLGHVSTREPFRKLFHQGLITSFAYERPGGGLVPVDAVREEGDGSFVEIATGQSVKQIVAKMSKSLKNVANPDDVIRDFGADTFRLYEMYMGPLEASKPWNPRDITGLFRFLQRAWRLLVREDTGRPKLAARADEDLEKLSHRLVAKVEHDVERLAFNTAIAAMIEFVNAATGKDAGEGSLSREQAERFALTLCPFAPHLGEELWHRLGHATLASHEPWPAVDPGMLVDREVELPVSVQGKVRTRIVVPSDATPQAIERAALADAKLIEFIAGKPIKKVIVVPGKMVNVVL